jgi:hypothetical protein
MRDQRLASAGIVASAVLLAAVGTFAGGRSDAPVQTDVWLTKRSRLHFDVWSQRGLSATEVEAVERNLNAVRRDVGRDLEVDDKTRYDVVLTDPSVFREYSGAGQHVAGLFDGKIHIPIPSAGQEQAVQGVLWHEYTHAVIQTKARGRCPQWLNEGIASYQQSKIDPRRRENLSYLLQKGDGLPLDWNQLEAAFRSRNPDMQGVAYLQAFAVADFLFKRYRRYQINALLEEIGETGDAIDALKTKLHITPEVLERKVIDHIRGS